MKEERNSHQKDLLEAQRAQQSMERSIIDNCRKEKDCLERGWESKYSEQQKVTKKEKADRIQKCKEKEFKFTQTIVNYRKRVTLF